jgi:hypothetical protein
MTRRLLLRILLIVPAVWLILTMVLLLAHNAPHRAVFRALRILLAVLAFNLPGDALRDWLDLRTRALLLTQQRAA